MLTVMKGANKKVKLTPEQLKELYKPMEIIVTRRQEVEEITPEGKLTKTIEKRVNITKMVNETKKVIKSQNAQSTVERIENLQKELLNKGVL